MFPIASPSGMTARIYSSYCAAAVGRSIVHQQQLPILEGLRQDAVYGFRQEIFCIEEICDDGDLYRRHHFLISRRNTLCFPDFRRTMRRLDPSDASTGSAGENSRDGGTVMFLSPMLSKPENHRVFPFESNRQTATLERVNASNNSIGC